MVTRAYSSKGIYCATNPYSLVPTFPDIPPPPFPSLIQFSSLQSALHFKNPFAHRPPPHFFLEIYHPLSSSPLIQFSGLRSALHFKNHSAPPLFSRYTTPCLPPHLSSFQAFSRPPLQKSLCPPPHFLPDIAPPVFLPTYPVFRPSVGHHFKNHYPPSLFPDIAPHVFLPTCPVFRPSVGHHFQNHYPPPLFSRYSTPCLPPHISSFRPSVGHPLQKSLLRTCIVHYTSDDFFLYIWLKCLY